MSVRDRLRARVEAAADEVWRVYREALDARGDGGDPDHRARLASVEGLLAQAYGRPPQAMVGSGEQPSSPRGGSRGMALGGVD
jgi:hypothetical protein